MAISFLCGQPTVITLFHSYSLTYTTAPTSHVGTLKPVLPRLINTNENTRWLRSTGCSFGPKITLHNHTKTARNVFYFCGLDSSEARNPTDQFSLLVSGQTLRHDANFSFIYVGRSINPDIHPGAYTGAQLSDGFLYPGDELTLLPVMVVIELFQGMLLLNWRI